MITPKENELKLALQSDAHHRIDELLAEGVNLKAQPKLGIWLYDQVQRNDLNGAFLLLQCGIQPDSYANDEGDRALHVAIQNNNIRMVKILLQFSASLAVKNDRRLTPMELAAELNHWDCVKYLASKRHTDVKDSFGYGPALQKAVAENQWISAGNLLAAGAEFSHAFRQGNQLLLSAVKCNSPQMLQLLITYGINTPQMSFSSNNPFVLAIQLKHWQCVQVINNARPAECAHHLAEALLIAVQNNQMEEVKLLLNLKAPTAAKTITKDSPLHVAIKRANFDLFKLLVSHQADLFVKNNDGFTPIQLARMQSTQLAFVFAQVFIMNATQPIALPLIVLDHIAKFIPFLENKKVSELRLDLIDLKVQCLIKKYHSFSFFSQRFGELTQLIKQLESILRLSPREKRYADIRLEINQFLQANQMGRFFRKNSALDLLKKFHLIREDHAGELTFIN